MQHHVIINGMFSSFIIRVAHNNPSSGQDSEAVDAAQVIRRVYSSTENFPAVV